jgi:hypothetical protein
VVETELIDEVEIEIGEVVDGIEFWRLLGAAEARMARSDHARPLGQAVEHRRRRLDADARMQEQERPPAAALGGVDADAIDHPARRWQSVAIDFCLPAIDGRIRSCSKMLLEEQSRFDHSAGAIIIVTLSRVPAWTTRFNIVVA